MDEVFDNVRLWARANPETMTSDRAAILKGVARVFDEEIATQYYTPALRACSALVKAFPCIRCLSRTYKKSKYTTDWSICARVALTPTCILKTKIAERTDFEYVKLYFGQCVRYVKEDCWDYEVERIEEDYGLTLGTAEDAEALFEAINEIVATSVRDL